MSIKITLCSNTKDRNRIIKELKWSLDRYLGSEESKLRIAVKPMSMNLGHGISIDMMIDQINSKNCFDFDYTPVEKDRLLISNNLDHSDYKYFGLIFREGKWIRGDYYTTKMPYKGIKMILENIGKGKIKTNTQQRV